MEKIILNINGIDIPFNDFGEAMNSQFKILYVARLTNRSYDRLAFEREALRAFDNYQEIGHHDAFFNNFAPLWGEFLKHAGILPAESYGKWHSILQINGKLRIRRKFIKGRHYISGVAPISF